MQETVVTLQGYLGTDVTLRQAGDSQVASFRLGCTPRRFNRRNGEWFDAPTQWFTVNAWRGLAENVYNSVKKAEPVVVHGRLNANTWKNKDEVEITTFEVEAIFVGHDLSRGTSSFVKIRRTGEPTVPAEVASPPDFAASPGEVAA